VAGLLVRSGGGDTPGRADATLPRLEDMTP
jgi:hypothetical protein